MRRALRQMAAAAILHEKWISLDASAVLQGLADALVELLSPDYVFVRFAENGGRAESDVLRSPGGRADDDSLRAFHDAVQNLPGERASEVTRVALAPDQLLRIATNRTSTAEGVLHVAVGSTCEHFAGPHELLLLNVCLSQAAAALSSAVQRDRTERVLSDTSRMVDSERAARAQAEKTIRQRDEFLNLVAHELRTPLNSVMGWAQLLRRASDEETQTQAVEAIERGARTQARLIEDLLDLSRMTSGRLRFDLRDVPIVSAIESAVAGSRPAADAKNIRILTDLNLEGGTVKGDSARVQQMISNILSNAVKFTPHGGTVHVRLHREGTNAEIVVTDSGIGIPTERLPYVFDGFHAPTAARSHGGLGLGLLLARHLAELHGGRVWVRSAGEGRGASFGIQLPLSDALLPGDGEPATAAQAESSSRFNEVDLEDVRVLVVDDDADALEMLRRVLRECGARVHPASSGMQALKRLDDDNFDILISDIGMPEMDGYELIRRVRAGGKALPAVAVTAFSRSEDRVRALLAGYNMHMAKPLEPRELVAIIAALVQRTSCN